MDKIKFGVIGFGFMGHVHEETITKQLDEAELKAICDIKEERMKDSITDNVNKYDDYKIFLEDKSFDTVIISAPNQLHKEMVINAAKAGKNIICEKPVAMNTDELDEMIEAAKRNKVIFTVHQQRRFDEDFRTMKEIYQSKELGDIYTVKSSLYGINGNMHDWHVYKEFGGGMLYDWGVHLIDQMLFMIDSEIKTVFADIRNVINKEVDDYFNIILKFKNGVTGQIELGTYFLEDKEKWFERHWFIGGNGGSAYSDGFKPEGKICKTTRLLENVPDKTTMTKSGPTRSFGPPPEGVLITEELPSVNTKHIMYFKNYINAVRGKEDFLVKISEVKRVLSLMETARKSAKESVSMDFE